MTQWTIPLEQGFKFFLYQESLLGLCLLLALLAPGNFGSFSKILFQTVLFWFGFSLIFIFGSLGFDIGFIPGSNIVLFSLLIVLVLWNFTLREKRNNYRQRKTGIRYVVALVFGLITGISGFGLLNSLSSGLLFDLKDAFFFSLGQLGYALVFLLALSFLYALFNTFFRVKWRDWILVLSSISLGLAIGFILNP